MADRSDRLGGNSTTPDSRTEFQRDRDRVLYSVAFRRLAEVTQVVGPLQGHVFHNRLTHSLEVAQIGRRLAEKLQKDDPSLQRELDADVVEAACLCHDLGHPPFGHAAEQELDRLARAKGLADGFEGNAQSFRIVTRLAERPKSTDAGLSLTRATLNAMLKYPWGAADELAAEKKKYGYYNSDAAAFEFARALGPNARDRCLESQIMDFADDIAYSVHDVDDFYRAGLLPLDVLAGDAAALDDFVADWSTEKSEDMVAHTDQFRAMLDLFVFSIPGNVYRGTRKQREGLRTFASDQIGRLIASGTVEQQAGALILRVGAESRRDIDFLKRLVWTFVIVDSRMTSVQAGHRAVVRHLFSYYYRAIRKNQVGSLPPFFHEIAEEVLTGPEAERRQASARLAIDIVASLADDQAIKLHKRILGIDSGALADSVDP